MPVGDVIKDYKIGNTHVVICSDSLLPEEEQERAWKRVDEMVSDMFHAMPREKIIEINKKYQKKG